MLNEIPVELLRKLEPINQLDDQRIDRLLGDSRVEPLPAHRKLTAQSCQQWLVYVIDGNVFRVPSGQRIETLLRDNSERYAALFADPQADDTAVTKTDSTILKIDAEMCRKMLADVAAASAEVVDVDVSDTEYTLFNEIYKACQNKTLELPAMPDVAMRLRRMAADPAISSQAIAKVIQLDPAIAGRIIQVVNSPLYRAYQAITSIRDAVVRLGLRVSTELATSLSMRNTFTAKSPLIRKRMNQAWVDSVDVSALCYVIARRLKSIDPEQALFAGLMHKIGEVPLLNFADKLGYSGAPETLQDSVEKLTVMASILVLDSWSLTTELGSVVEHSADWQRDDVNTADYCDVVLLARLIHAQEQGHTDLPEPDSLPAFARLTAASRDQSVGILDLIAEATEQRDTMRAVLLG